MVHSGVGGTPRPHDLGIPISKMALMYFSSPLQRATLRYLSGKRLLLLEPGSIQ